MIKRSAAAIIALIMIVSVISGCGSEKTDTTVTNAPGQVSSDSEDNNSNETDKIKESEDTALSDSNPIVTIEMEDGGIITIELYPDVAPNTVNNFISLINKGYYDGVIFHRVIPGFMIQGGDPDGNGVGGPGYAIKGEFSANGFKNTLAHTRGVISMARTKIPDSAGSQFFIMVDSASYLDGQYAAFGKVLSGMEVVDKIVSAKTNAADKPMTDQRMKKVTVDTRGVDYDEPVTLPEY
ncbi:MAG: peptidylprolyl isomerase [Clostridia bacterium]|nr:peptidylprolyl isomerase [Clostridia bacterium]